jgi:hypothetical protein
LLDVLTSRFNLRTISTLHNGELNEVFWRNFDSTEEFFWDQ